MRNRCTVVTAAALLAAARPAAAAPLTAFRSHGVAFRYPRAWHVTTRRLDNVIDPHTIAAVSSYAVLRGPHEDCDGTRARGRPQGGAFVLVKEVLDGASRRLGLRRLGPKPRHFSLPASGRAGCLPPVSTVLQFRAAGRVFYIFVSVGPRATAQTRLAVEHLVDSFKAIHR
jgi:hypothetical protein